MTEKLFHVAVEAPLFEPLTYRWSHDQAFIVQRGHSVKVPLGRRTVNAVILRETGQAGDYKLKNIREPDSERPILSETFLQWLEWLSKYYAHPIGQVTGLAFPPLKKIDKQRKSHKAPVVPDMTLEPPLPLSSEQLSCYQQISQVPGFDVHLLHGVTGSGKTEVYLHLLADVVRAGGQGLLLVPEISLTPQLVQRFAARFPEKIAVLHSHLTDRERTTQWWNAFSGEKNILIGARSALFCPIKNLSLIIVDEEHEASFKQDEKLRYNGRDAAIMLAKLHNCPIVLGSATPSLESWQNALSGKYHLHQMKSRVSERPLPNIRVINLKDKKPESDSERPFWMSDELFKCMTTALDKNNQVALFLNRRGTAQFVQCFDCGFTYECPNCAISLTLHGRAHLVCHYCNYSQALTEHCPQCESEKISPQGLGTEQVESDVKKLFPQCVVARADRDEISRREQLEEMIRDMEQNKIQILIGTQMIAKGLDFPHLTVVGLLLADVGFHIPDFRANERSFQLITQVAGRAGRHSHTPGEVLIQTFSPHQPSIEFSVANDYAGFANYELAQRQSLNYPPFGRVATIRTIHSQLHMAEKSAQLIKQHLFALKNHRSIYKIIDILGPAPAPLTKLRNKYRYHILLKSPKPNILQPFASEVLVHSNSLPSGTKVQIDIDPYNML